MSLNSLPQSSAMYLWFAYPEGRRNPQYKSLREFSILLLLRIYDKS